MTDINHPTGGFLYGVIPFPTYRTSRVWVKIKPAGIGPQVLVIVSIYQGANLGLPGF